MSSSAAVIDLKRVNFKYRSELILEDVTFQIVAGDFVGLIGPNGSGKTTLLKIILGLLQPSSGKAQLFSQQPQHFTQWTRIGYVPQKNQTIDAQFPLTVAEVVGMANEDAAAVTQALKIVKLEAHSHRLLSELSGGQQQRVFIARALVNQPELLILDEPTVGVDSESQASFYQLLKQLNQKQHLTLLLVSHDIDVVAREVKTLACLNKGMVAFGPAQEIAQSNVLKKLYGDNVKLVIHKH